MVADGMSACDDFLENIWMFADVVSNAEKSGFRLIFFKFGKYKFGNFRNRAVIKSQENLVLPIRNVPNVFWKQPFNDFMGFDPEFHWQKNTILDVRFT